MTEPSYSFRLHPFAHERTYVLGPDALAWKDGAGECRLAYAEVEKALIGQVRYPGSSKRYWSCLLFPRHGGIVRLSAAHHLGLRRIEERSERYMPFVLELQSRLAAANPRLVVAERRSLMDRVGAAFGLVGVGFLRLLRHLDIDRVGGFAGGAMRLIGPWLRGHRVAREQVRMAFPEKSDAEIERILSGMWDNLGRVFVEYAHLDRLWDFDSAHPNTGRIVMEPDHAARLAGLGTVHEAALMYSAHIGNWEIPALAAPRDIELVFRAPRTGLLAEELNRIRRSCVANVIQAGPDAPLRIRDGLKRGNMVGMLVDQHFNDGVEVAFFGRTCKANPILARFARMFECPIYGSRVIRLPGGRFRFELYPPLDPPRDRHGKIDVAATTQLMTSVIEGWVREHPEQWMWLHRRLR